MFQLPARPNLRPIIGLEFLAFYSGYLISADSGPCEAISAQYAATCLTAGSQMSAFLEYKRRNSNAG
jgi:hypothetical protein